MESTGELPTVLSIIIIMTGATPPMRPCHENLSMSHFFIAFNATSKSDPPWISEQLSLGHPIITVNHTHQRPALFELETWIFPMFMTSGAVIHAIGANVVTTKCVNLANLPKTPTHEKISISRFLPRQISWLFPRRPANIVRLLQPP